MALRLAVRTESGGATPSQLHRELGDNYFYVRGDCSYWVLDYQQNPGWAPTRTGVLTREQEQLLFEELRYDQLAELAGVYQTPSNPGEWETYYDGTNAVWCQDGCYEGHPTAPDELEQMSAHARAWRKDLWVKSATMTGPVRVIIFKGGVSDEPQMEDPCLPVWPFSLDPEEYAYDRDDPAVADAGTSSLIDQLDEAAELRSYWLDYREDPTCDPLGWFALSFLSAEDPRVWYGLYVRDAVPLENDLGLIPIPFP